jgi:hypothetical protein
VRTTLKIHSSGTPTSLGSRVYNSIVSPRRGRGPARCVCVLAPARLRLAEVRGLAVIYPRIVRVVPCTLAL